VLSIIKHENIVAMVDFKQTAHNLYLVFEHCKFTDLNAYIRDHYAGRLPEDRVRRILAQLCGAFRVIRQHKVVHRDLKLSNILVTEDFEIKLADFGFAKLLEEDEFLRSQVGTPLTMAPEVIERKEYNEKCDIWSLGVITYQMLFGCNPFFKQQEKMTATEIRDALQKEIHFPFPISPLAEDFVRRMLVRDPNARMSFPEFFEHEWLREEQGRGSLSEILRSEALRV
jgi:serine/threonine protein kinase